MQTEDHFHQLTASYPTDRSLLPRLAFMVNHGLPALKQNLLDLAKSSSHATAFCPPDDPWLSATESRNEKEKERLERQVKAANGIKEAARSAYAELAEFYEDCADVSMALKCWFRARDSATTPKHIIDYSLRLISLSLNYAQYLSVPSHVIKAEKALDSLLNGKEKAKL